MTHPQGEPGGQTDSVARSFSPRRMETVVLLLLVFIPSAFNAISLLPEVSLPIPSVNDDAVHYLFVQRASEALANGENPVDHWVPELDLGFPQFFYYQHLPHLAVVLLHRLLLKQVDLLTLFNLTRYLLLVAFPFTVYWSMRRLGFSLVAGAVGAAAATLLVSRPGFGFEYGSYVWRGFGMYTQLWAVHLLCITLACLDRLLERGTGYLATIVAWSALALAHLIYTYIMVVGALVLFLVGLNQANWRQRLGRLAIPAVLAAVISSYLWLPWLLSKAYMGVISPYLERWKYDSHGAGEILPWLLNGDLLDYGRLPVLTVLLALGVSSALLARTRPALIALILFLVMLGLFFGRPTWGKLADLLPMGGVLHFLRFAGGVHLGAILLIGLGGEWIWRQFAWLPERWRAMAAGVIILALIVPALQERQRYHALGTQMMEQTRKALDADGDARTILSALRELPPGRTHAGLRGNWGKEMKFGGIHFYDLLIFSRIATVSPPYQGISLNSDLIWHFDDRDLVHYSIFNVRYVVAPSDLNVPAFLRPAKVTPRYTLYRAETSGYGQFAASTEPISIVSQSSLFFRNRSWLLSAEPAAGRFIRYEYPARTDRSAGSAGPECSRGGKIVEGRVLPGRIDLEVECQQASTLVLKVTYHPNWHVTIDDRRVKHFMVSPSFIGLEVPSGLHHIRAEYRSPRYKLVLLFSGVATLLATIVFRRRFARLDALLS